MGATMRGLAIPLNSPRTSWVPHPAFFWRGGSCVRSWGSTRLGAPQIQQNRQIVSLPSGSWLAHISPVVGYVGFRVPWVPHPAIGWVDVSAGQMHAQSTLGLTLSDIVANERVPHPYRRFLAIGWVPSTIPYCPIRETLRHARPYYTCMSSPSRAFAYCLSLVASR